MAAIKENTVLKELSMASNGFSSKDAPIIADSISANGALASLDLSQNSIPDSEASQIKTACEAKKISLKI